MKKIHAINVIIKLIIPWINFKSEYLNNDTSKSPIKELIWDITDKPEKEQIKLTIDSLSANGNLDKLISLQPLVNSILPRKVPYKDEDGKLKISSIFLKVMLK